ncbi:MAG: transposase [Pirellulales bacterium]|nr:transposase [Pirellulales bacterium]
MALSDKYLKGMIMVDMGEFLKDDVCFFVTDKAVNGNYIFLYQNDYNYYMRLIKRFKDQHDIRVFAFCLLPRAVHLVLQTPLSGSLRQFMDDLKSNYRRYFHSKYQDERPLWDNSYHSRVIDNDQELFRTVKDLEFIPVQKCFSPTPIQYPWSSCSYRVVDTPSSLLDRRMYHCGASESADRFSPRKK